MCYVITPDTYSAYWSKFYCSYYNLAFQMKCVFFVLNFVKYISQKNVTYSSVQLIDNFFFHVTFLTDATYIPKNTVITETDRYLFFWSHSLVFWVIDLLSHPISTGFHTLSWRIFLIILNECKLAAFTLGALFFSGSSSFLRVVLLQTVCLL